MMVPESISLFLLYTMISVLIVFCIALIIVILFGTSYIVLEILNNIKHEFYKFKEL